MARPHRTISMSPSMYHALDEWRRKECPDKTMSGALEQIVHHIMALPEKVKRAAWPPRRMTGLGVRPYNFSLPDDSLWETIESHGQRYGLNSRSEVIREFLRLGLGLPPPSFGKESCQRMVRQMQERGIPQVQIARDLGISRQRVSYILNRTCLPPYMWGVTGD